MLAPDRDGHAPDADRNGIAAERPKVKWLDSYAFIEAELPETVGFALVECSPVDGRDTRPRAERQTIEANRIGMKGRIHYCD